MLFDLDNVYNFNTKSLTVLEPTYRNMKAISYLSFKTAIKYSGVFNDVVTTREQLILETGLPFLDARKVKYVLFEDRDGNEVVLAEDWIDANSIDLVTAIELDLKVSNITTTDVTIILNTLKAMGYTSIESEIIDATI